MWPVVFFEQLNDIDVPMGRPSFCAIQEGKCSLHAVCNALPPPTYKISSGDPFISHISAEAPEFL